MRTRPSLLALLPLLAAPSLALASLKDVGPTDPATGFPQWYRDTNGSAVSLCTEERPSPNASSGGAPMCFPIVPDPAGYPGNLGSEVFFYNASTNLAGANGFSLLWEGAIEATYANGTPIRGDEITFARIRIVMSTQRGGTYTVTHPYGVEVFPDVQPGNRAVFYTVDIGINPGTFTGALAGAVGPFLEWSQDVANPSAPFGIDPVSLAPYSLQIANADGTTVQFLGDPNLFHTVQGSPFGTNLVRVDGPPGSNLDGAGNDFVVTNLFAVVGQRFTVPIPTFLHIYEASYAVDGGVARVDVFAESAPGAQLVVTGDNLPTHELLVDPAHGEGWGHTEFAYDPARPLPAQVTVTNLGDDPHSKGVAPLTDHVTTGPAVFTPDATGVFAGSMAVIAESSVHLDPAPDLAIVELPNAVKSLPDPTRPWMQRFDATIPLGSAPPWLLTARSTLGGSHGELIVVGATGVFAPVGPTALPQALSTLQGTPVTFDAKDPLTPAAVVMVLNPPAGGTAAVNLDGTITYTPNNLFNGVDELTYLLYVPDPIDPANTKKWVYSNAGHVRVDVLFQNVPPTAVADFATTPANTPVTFSLAANDTDVDGTVVPSSAAVVSQPVAGTVLNNGDGTVTYTPSPGFAGVVSFTYTIQDGGGAVSAPGTAQVTVHAQTESLLVTRADWTSSKGRWRVDGSTDLFGPGVVNSVSVYVGLSPGQAVLLGTVPIDPATGTWTLDVTSSLGPDGSNQVTAISTGGGSATRTIVRK